MQRSCARSRWRGAGFDSLHDGVDLAVDGTDEGERELALGGERLLGEVEGAVEGAGDVDAGHGQGKASGQQCGRTGAWLLVRLPHEQVDQHGEHDRGDYREHDHEQASWPAAQWPYLHPSRSHL